MPLDAATVLALAAICAPHVPPRTLLAIARVESALNPLAIGVNGAEATQTAAVLLSRGADLDLGLAQINSRNLPRLGLSVSEAFEPCSSLRAAADVLAAGYSRTPRLADPQTRLRTALSYYNTGHPNRGFRNGYVGKVAVAAGVRAPASPSPVAPPPALPPAWRVFRAEANGAAPFVLSFSSGDRP